MVFRNPFRRANRSLADDIAAVSALDDPIRAAVFSYVAKSGSEVSRDRAAKQVGVTRRVAAFHLDKLAEDGWLDVSFRRLTGRTGPGAGRSSKLYRRSDRRVDVSVPPRNYELMARLLASALQSRDGVEAVEGLKPGARDFGSALGRAARSHLRGSATPGGLKRILLKELQEHGFEPFVDSGAVIRLRNCPYHDLAREKSDFVCAVNLALMQGVTQGLDLPEDSSVLEPRDGACCVAFHFEPTWGGEKTLRALTADQQGPR